MPPSPSRRSLATTLCLAAVTVLGGASACEPDSASSDTTAAAVTTSTTTTVPATTVPPSTTSTTVPVDLLGSCVEHAKFQAFTGNEFWAAMWEDAGRTDEGMRATCAFLATDRPGWLEEVHANWTELQSIAGAVPATTDATTDATDAAAVTTTNP